MNNFDEAVSGELIEAEASSGKELQNVLATDIGDFNADKILTAVSKGGELDFLIKQLREKVAGFDHDLTTGVGRKRSASFAYSISTAKTKVIGFANNSIAIEKQKIKKVTASIKNVGLEFDVYRDAARLPLTEWEAEEAERKAVEAARIEAEKLLEEFNNDHEMGLLLDEKFDRELEAAMVLAESQLREAREKEAQEAKELAAKQEQERIERDARIAQEAAEKAIKESLDRAEREAELVRVDKFNSDHEIAILTNNRMIADAEKIATEERAKVQAEEAEKRRIEAAEQAKRDAIQAAENARLAEVKRQEDEAARVKAEDEKREANKQNRLKKHKSAKKCFVEILGFSDKDATSAVQAVSEGLIDNITIKY